MNFPLPQSPLHHGLIFKNRFFNLFFRFLNFCCRKEQPQLLPIYPRKILVCNFGHLGDLLLCSKAIAALKAAYPEATISFLIASHAQSIFEGRNEKVHLFDHWFYRKQTVGLCKAALQHWKLKKMVVAEIRAEQYDLSIELRPYFPNAIGLVKRGRIPCCVGYGSAGFPSLLTHRFDWTRFDRYFGDLHLTHLTQVGFPLGSQSGQFLPFAKEFRIDLPPKFIVAHLCSSKKGKDWPRARWIELIRRLDLPVVLMGQGEKDGLECEVVARETGAINLCDRASISDYGAILKRAELLITVDSMPVHLAGLLSVPMIILFMEVNFPHLWVPTDEDHKRCLFFPTVEEVLFLKMRCEQSR